MNPSGFYVDPFFICPAFVRPINCKKPQVINLQLFIVAREERLELPTPGFGDRCSTN